MATTKIVFPQDYGQKVMASLISNVNTACTEIANDAFEIAPKDTGFMASTVDVEEAEIVADGKVEGKVTVSAYYSKYVEKGTSKMEAQPFLEPAVDKNRNKAVLLIASSVKEGAK